MILEESLFLGEMQDEIVALFWNLVSYSWLCYTICKNHRRYEVWLHILNHPNTDYFYTLIQEMQTDFITLAKDIILKLFGKHLAAW